MSSSYIPRVKCLRCTCSSPSPAASCLAFVLDCKAVLVIHSTGSTLDCDVRLSLGTRHEAKKTVHMASLTRVQRAIDPEPCTVNVVRDMRAQIPQDVGRDFVRIHSLVKPTPHLYSCIERFGLQHQTDEIVRKVCQPADRRLCALCTCMLLWRTGCAPTRQLTGPLPA